MNGISEQDRAVRSRARGFAVVVLTIFLTGMIALGTPQDPDEAAPAPAAHESAQPPQTVAQAPAATHPHPFDETPWQWDPTDY
jgi:hypothetical protein